MVDSGEPKTRVESKEKKEPAKEASRFEFKDAASAAGDPAMPMMFVLAFLSPAVFKLIL